MSCKNICIRHKVSGAPSGLRYAAGQKRCNTCELFINWDGVRCPCCSCRLRTAPRNSKLRAKSKNLVFL